MRAPRWGLWDVVIGYVGALVIAVVVEVVIVIVNHGNEDFSPTAQIIGLVAPWIAWAGWPLVATWRRGNGRPPLPGSMT